MYKRQLLIKPASSLCNLRCRYCFYADVSDNREVKSMGVMSRETAGALIEAAFAAADEHGAVDVYKRQGLYSALYEFVLCWESGGVP